MKIEHTFKNYGRGVRRVYMKTYAHVPLSFTERVKISSSTVVVNLSFHPQTIDFDLRIQFSSMAFVDNRRTLYGPDESD